MDLLDIINHIPDILIYVLPGYMGLQFFEAVRGHKNKWESTLLLSCSISFIAVSLVRLWFKLNNIYAEMVIATVLCFIGSYVLSLMLQEKSIRKIFKDSLHYSFAKNTLDNIVDLEGTMVRVKLKGMKDDVAGQLASYNDTSSEGMIALKYYGFYDPDQQPNEQGEIGPYYDRDGDEEYFVFRICEVEWMEVWSISDEIKE